MKGWKQMEIEIITTKKKLTKSIVKQMFRANLKKIEEYRVLGHVTGASKRCFTELLLEKNGEYYTLETGWKKAQQNFYRSFGKYTITYKFDSEEECNKVWNNYQLVLEKGMKTHIYL